MLKSYAHEPWFNQMFYFDVVLAADFMCIASAGNYTHKKDGTAI